MPKILRNLRIDSVASVDRGAGEGVRVVLMKRDDGGAVDAYLKRDWFAELADKAKLEKREFSAKEREEAAARGAALPDGSFPIENAEDLHNAMRAIGRAKDPAKAKAHIRSRARALGLESELTPAFKSLAKKLTIKHGPDGRITIVHEPEAGEKTVDKRATGIVAKLLSALFRKDAADGDADAVTFEEALGEVEAHEFAQGMMHEVCEAIDALRTSVCSILNDGTVTDKQAVLEQTFRQFKEHVQGIVPEEMEKALAAGVAATIAGLSVGNQEVNAMNAEIKKALGLADSATDADLTAAVAKLLGDLAIAKAGMSEEEKKYHDGLKDDGEKEKFRGMSREERVEHMKKRDDLPEHVRKALAEGEELKKRLAALEDDKELATLSKRATDIGLPDDHGAVIQKALRGDKEAVNKLLDLLKAANAAARAGGVFKELGGAGRETISKAYDELKTKADELRKRDPGLTEAQAFAKVYADPANADLVKRERAENRPSA